MTLIYWRARIPYGTDSLRGDAGAIGIEIVLLQEIRSPQIFP
ncbi:hypothetical protein [Trichormus variabilis]|nr:hypothetical protein [Trichormus variabilis]